MENKHTPTPWTKRDIEIIGPYMSNKSICEVTGNFMDEAEAMANLTHIVKCVNAHDELVKALQNVSSLLDFAINATQTGAIRNLLTDANIIAIGAIQKVSSKDHETSL